MEALKYSELEVLPEEGKRLGRKLVPVNQIYLLQCPYIEIYM
jgi:hypothetical protein